jgi:hypothetical protein
MATIIHEAPHQRVRKTEFPAASRAFDWGATFLSVLLMSGLNVDVWAHNHNRVDNTFFTVWHALMYGAFLLFAGFLTLVTIRNLNRGYGLANALPRGYVLSLLGVAVFSIGGIGDMLWHTAFGIEKNTEALLSPTHLVLGIGFILLFSGPVRAVWLRAEQPGANRWLQLLPAVIGLSLGMTILMVFTQYANSTYNAAYAGWNAVHDTSEPNWLTLPLGISSIILQTAIMMGGLLLLVRRWRLPFGAATLVILLPSMFISVYQDTMIFLPGIFIAGLVAEVLLWRLRPATARPLQMGIFAFLVPTVYYIAFFLTIQAVQGVGWRIHAWAGAIAFAGFTGLLMALLQVVPTRPSEA